MPAIGSHPGLVATWWSGLSADEQRYLILSEPTTVDALDGIPVDARDQAGRLLLHEERASLSAALSERSATNGSPSARATAAAIQARLTGLAVLESRLDDPRKARSYLLGLDSTDETAIIAIGDPDRASDVLTMVPGVGSDLTNIATTINPVDNLYTAGDALGGSRAGLAAVGWSGYQAPPTLQSAMTIAPATAAAPPLSRFDAGLRDTHVGSPAHETVLGYSYGSVVVGAAAHASGLTDDDIIFVGSPGVGVGHPSDLRVDPSHVWATVAKGDVIQAAVRPRSLIARLTGDSLPAWFGSSPTAPDFGARVFASDPGSWTSPIETHGRYFDAGTRSLTNIAKIVTGDGAEVS